MLGLLLWRRGHQKGVLSVNKIFSIHSQKIEFQDILETSLSTNYVRC